MRRASIALISLVIVVILGGTAYGYVANQRSWWPFGNTSPLTALTNPVGRFVDLVPPETLFYGHFDLNNANNAATVASNNQLNASVQILKQGWNKLMAQMEAQTPVPAEVKALFELVSTHEVELALIPRNISGTAKNFAETTSIVGGLTLKSGEDINQQMVAIKGAIKSGLSSNQDMIGTDNKIGNHTVTTIKIVDKTDTKAQAPELFLTNLQNQLLLVTTDNATMTQVLGNSDNSNHTSLSNQTSFPKLQSKIAKNQLITAYMNGEKELLWQEAINKVMDIEQDPMMEAFNQKIQTAVTSSNLLKYQAMFGISLNSSGLLMTAYTNFADPETVKAYSNSGLVYNAQVPDNALFYAEMHNITAPLAMIAPLMQSLDESVSIAMNERTTVVEQIEKATGLSVVNDLAPLFQQNSAIAIVPHPLALTPISISILTQVSDTAKAQSTMDKITASLVKSFNESSDPTNPQQVKQQTINGATINSFGQIGEAGSPIGEDYMYNFVLRSKDVLVSSSLDEIKSLLAPTKTLANGSNYPSFLKQAGAVNGVTFINIRGIVDLMKPFIIGQMNAATIDLSNPEATPDPQLQTQMEAEVMPYLNLIRNISAFSRQENDMVRSDMLVQMVD